MTFRLVKSAAAPHSEPPGTPLRSVGQDPPARARVRAAATPPSLYRTVPGLVPLDQPCSECSDASAFFVVDDRARLVFFCQEHIPAPDASRRHVDWGHDDRAPLMLGTMLISLVLLVFGAALLAFSLIVL